MHRSILVLDIESSTSRSNPVKEELRRHLYRILDEALAFIGVDEKHREPYEDRGDGVIALIHPADEIPKPHLVSRLVPELAQSLLDHNLSLPPQELARRGMRLRVAIHAGEVHRDGNGFFGEALDIACRLLEARRLKRSLATSTDPLVLVVSEELYRGIVRHGYDGLRPEAFTRDIHVSVGGHRHHGWLQIPTPLVATDTA